MHICVTLEITNCNSSVISCDYPALFVTQSQCLIRSLFNGTKEMKITRQMRRDRSKADRLNQNAVSLPTNCNGRNNVVSPYSLYGHTSGQTHMTKVVKFRNRFSNI